MFSSWAITAQAKYEQAKPTNMHNTTQNKTWQQHRSICSLPWLAQGVALGVWQHLARAHARGWVRLMECRKP